MESESLGESCCSHANIGGGKDFTVSLVTREPVDDMRLLHGFSLFAGAVFEEEMSRLLRFVVNCELHTLVGVDGLHIPFYLLPGL